LPRRIDYFLVPAAAVLFGVNQPLSRVLIDESLPATYLAASRMMAVAAIFLVWALLQKGVALPRGRPLAMLLVYGVLGIAVLQWMLTSAIASLDVGLVLTIGYTASLLSAIWCLVVRHERQPRAVWLLMALALFGLALAVGLGGDALGNAPVEGLLFAGGVAVMFAYYALHGERLVRDLPASVVLGVAAPAAAIFWTLTFAPIWDFPTEILTEPVSLGGNLSGIVLPGALVLAWSMLFGTALPYILYLVGVGRVGPTFGLLSGTIEPIVAVIAAWLWIDQRLSLLQVTGCVIVFAAVIAVQIMRSRQTVMA
jgi:drug/metabolite transporter (DMT)-like permease